MKAGTRLLLIGLCAYPVFLVLSLPAGQLYAWFSPMLKEQAPEVQLHHIGGRALEGSIGSLALRNKPVGSLHWDVNILPMFLGEANMDMLLQAENSYLQGQVGLPFSLDRIELISLTGQLALSDIFRHLPYYHVRLDGVVIPRENNLVVDSGGALVSATGRVEVRNLQVVVPVRAVIGDLLVTLDTDEEGTISATVRDSGGPLAVDMNVSLMPDGRYRATGSLSAAPNADESLKESLSLLGRRGADGAYHIDRMGRI